MVLDNTCSNKPTEIWVSKRDLTNDEELPGATLAIKDTDGDTVTTWVSTDEPHRVTGLHFGESYTLTEIRAADGYALANDITFRLIQKSDEDGKPRPTKYTRLAVNLHSGFLRIGLSVRSAPIWTKATCTII